LQKKLLRFIQTGTFQKVGSNKTEQVDIRFVCATNRDPYTEVQEGRFREDLYYRLHVVPIELPPLRERGEDVLQIANHFLSEMASAEQRDFEGFSKDAVELLLSYSWPGNVRELQNVVQRTIVLNEGGVISANMLPIAKAAAAKNTEPVQPELEDQPINAADQIEGLQQKNTKIEPLWLVEKRAIEAAIEATDNNINKAAALLDVAPSTLYRKVQSWKKDQQAG